MHEGVSMGRLCVGMGMCGCVQDGVAMDEGMGEAHER